MNLGLQITKIMLSGLTVLNSITYHEKLNQFYLGLNIFRKLPMQAHCKGEHVAPVFFSQTNI